MIDNRVINPGDLVLVDFSTEGDTQPRLLWVPIVQILYVADKIPPEIEGGESEVRQSIFLIVERAENCGTETVSLSRVSAHKPLYIPRPEFEDSPLADASISITRTGDHLYVMHSGGLIFRWTHELFALADPRWIRLNNTTINIGGQILADMIAIDNEAVTFQIKSHALHYPAQLTPFEDAQQ